MIQPSTVCFLPLLAISSVISAQSLTAAVPPSVTDSGPVSSILATATLTPDLGNPADISTYPQCAQICNNETIVVLPRAGAGTFDPSNLEVACGPTFRSLTAGCEAATCDTADYTKTQQLAQQLCGSLYETNATLSSSVSSAIASETAAAIAATSGKDPTDLSSLPTCGQNCILQINYGGCGSLSNRECICQGIRFNDEIQPCETANCSAADLKAIAYIAEVLCEPVGGVLTNPVNYTGSTSNASNTTTTSPSPSPSPFTGGSSQLRMTEMASIVTLASVVLGLLLL